MSIQVDELAAMLKACAGAIEGELITDLVTYATHLDDCDLTPCTCGLFDVLVRASNYQRTMMS